MAIIIAPMCGRFALSLTSQELFKLFPNSQPFDWEPSYNIAPDALTPMLINNQCLKKAKWGFYLPQIKKNVINARTETLHEKQSFKSLWPKNKCAIVTTGFFEWKGKQPHYIHLPNQEPLFLGALYRFNKGACEYVVLTQDAGEKLHQLHHRKPLMLAQNRLNDWFSDDCGFSYPLDETKLQLQPVTKEINKPAFNNPNCLKEVKEAQRDLFLDL